VTTSALTVIPAIYNLEVSAALLQGLADPNLTVFIALHGKTLVGAALGLNVDPSLFVRVSAGKQPFPAPLLAPLAQYLGSDIGSLKKACRQITAQALVGQRVGPPTLAPFNRVLMNPRPPDPSSGDPLTYSPLTQNQTTNPI
jgi:hypothetical protein